MTVAPAEENCCHEMTKKGKKKICTKHVCSLLAHTVADTLVRCVPNLYHVITFDSKAFVQSIVKSQNESSSSGGSGTALNSENSVSDWVKSKIHALNDNHMPYDLLKGL